MTPLSSQSYCLSPSYICCFVIIVLVVQFIESSIITQEAEQTSEVTFEMETIRKMPAPKKMTIFGATEAIRVMGTLKPTHNEPYVLLSRKFEGRVEPKETGQIVRVMQWNVLAQGLTESNPRKNYCKTPPRYLAWETRRYLLLLEMMSYMPDIIILQEVDRYEFLEPKLREFGYRGKFKERPNSPVKELLDGDPKPDGCAIFYHTDRFDSVDCQHKQLLNQAGNPTGCLALCLRLVMLEDNSSLLVVTSHFKGGAENELARYEASLDLSDFIAEHSAPDDMVIIGADLCEAPEGKGYDLIASKFKDAYSFALDGKHLPYTTWRMRPSGEEKYSNDCVFFNEKQFRVLQVLDTPVDAAIGGCKLPNNTCGSDHISLVCDLQRIINND